MHLLGSDNACVTVGDTIYVGGGYNDDYSTAYNATYAFTLSGTWPALGGVWRKLSGELRQPRGDYSMVSIGGAIYAYGGYEVLPNAMWWCTPINTIEKYAIASDAWAPAGFQMTIASAEKDDGVSIDGRLYVIGGEVKANLQNCVDTDIVPLKKVYSINPLTAASEGWREEMDLPEGRMRFMAESFEGSAYIFGGQGALIDSDTLPIKYSALRITPGDAPAPPALGPGPIAGIVIAALLFAAAAAVCACRRRAASPLSKGASGAEV